MRLFFDRDHSLTPPSFRAPRSGEPGIHEHGIVQNLLGPCSWFPGSLATLGPRGDGQRIIANESTGFRNPSIETPLARIGPAHLSISLRMNLPRYSGERCSGGATVLPSRL